MTRYLILEGCHGTGTSHHADALRAALESHLWLPSNPVRIAVYHHPRHPDGYDGVARVAWYAGARAEMLRTLKADVVVMDRGPLSGVVYAQSLRRDFLNRATAFSLSADEYASEPWRSASTVILDADDDVLDARLRERGEDPATAHAERWQWSKMLVSCGWVTPVRTDRPAAVVEAELLTWALRAMEVPR